MTGSDASPSFTLAYVPGVTPTKWVRIWNERLPGVPLTLTAVPTDEAERLLRARGADAGFLRLPVDRTDMSAIPLYTEATVVVIPKDHLVAVAEEITTADLADEILLHPLDDVLEWEELPGRPANERPATTADAVELVAAGIGVVVVPQSLARLHHRRDLTYRTVTDAPVSRVALAWPEDATTDLVEQFIGIVRGRTVNSSRGPQAVTAERNEGGGRGAGGDRKRAAGAGGRSGGKPGGGRSGAAKGAAKGTSKGAPKGSSKGAAKGAPRGAAKRGKPRKRP
ncbi:LysR family transcriptional regulator substrate-binding protein [Streptomyces evansiae]|uniref:LysR family transcriptional regulator substrate-binding protein n=1 Tax=Streptomyces evansiae TaxID=3075535 RepID=UPI0028865043|nr:LysR family transcriptional regulator substrate-binding protein [Streptomyces sp. DSM 41859]MDT0420819.1 LysR family transcriptional regulator substrate-binding protein [Streptomyces sp. DSM 41859]